MEYIASYDSVLIESFLLAPVYSPYGDWGEETSNTSDNSLFVFHFLECQDLQDEVLCSEEKEAGNCLELPWSGSCRKTCDRCG